MCLPGPLPDVPLPPSDSSTVIRMRREEAECRRSHDIDNRERRAASDLLQRDAKAKQQGIESDVPAEELMAACRLLATAPPPQWGAAAARERTADWVRHLSQLSEADEKHLAKLRAREQEQHERRQALKPAALLSRLKARAARVTWDSWG